MENTENGIPELEAILLTSHGELVNIPFKLQNIRSALFNV